MFSARVFKNDSFLYLFSFLLYICYLSLNGVTYILIQILDRVKKYIWTSVEKGLENQTFGYILE